MTTPSFTRRTAIIDAHAHLYDGGANRYGIFATKDPAFEAFVGDYSALPRTYLLDDYLRATSSRGRRPHLARIHLRRSHQGGDVGAATGCGFGSPNCACWPG